jgi:hypothetical protein
MARIYSMDHLTEVTQIEKPVYMKPSVAHTQAPQPQQRTVTLCASCKHQSSENFDVCNASEWEGGPVGKVFVTWKCSGWEAK